MPPRQLPALRAEVIGQSVGSDASPLSCTKSNGVYDAKSETKSCKNGNRKSSVRAFFCGEKRALFYRFRTIGQKWLTFAFTPKSGHTLDSQREIAHSGPHAETGVFRIGMVSLPSERFAPAFTFRQRTAGGSRCAVLLGRVILFAFGRYPS